MAGGVSLSAWAVRDGNSTPPIPEPETYAMLLAGLGLIGFAARRRKQKAESSLIASATLKQTHFKQTRFGGFCVCGEAFLT